MSVVGRLSERNDMKVAALLVLVCLASQTDSSPVKFVCDMCEANWVSCIMQCSLEQFITRDQYDRDNVYMGKKKEHKPPQPEHERMMEMFLLQQTGHDCLNC